MAVDYRDVMKQFGRAFFRADRELLADVVTPEFEWHNHWFAIDDPAPTGRVLRGLDEVMDEIARRRTHWTDVTYENVLERFSPGLVTQTFTISGVDRGTRFRVAGVDLYDVTAVELIAKKDTYWKYADATR